jgi:hypothetical protein
LFAYENDNLSVQLDLLLMVSAATAGGVLLLTLVAAIAYHFKLLPGPCWAC